MASKKTYLSEFPELMKEWDFEKNIEFDPNKLASGSGKKVWWKCAKGHEWQAVIKSRKDGCGCPFCAGKRLLKGFNDLQTLNPILAKEWNYEQNGDLTPDQITVCNGRKVWWKCSQGHEWQSKVSNRKNNCGCPICSGKKVLIGYNDLKTVNPTLAKEWDYERNGKLTPEQVVANSNKKVWWKCSKGHEWCTTIAHRNQNRSCPVCSSERKTSFPEYAMVFYLKKSGLEVIHTYREKGYELDIYIPSKRIAIEYDGYYWHKNKEKQDLNKNAKCKKDGIQLYRIREGLPLLNDSSIDYVVQNDQKDLSAVLAKILSEIIGMSVDVNLKRDAISIENLRELTEKEKSILISNPEAASEWDYNKNGNLRPEHFSAFSNKKVCWKCSKGHEWEATIGSRNKGHKCPFCSGKYAIKGETDLQTVCPELAREWNYELNNGLKPSDVTLNSNKKVWWKCSEGHEWQALIYDRKNGVGCQYCSGRKVLKGFNDLQTVNPTLASEWNYEKNGDLTPEHFTVKSEQKVWWKCSKGHEWQAVIGSRNKGYRCPHCSGQKVIKGENDLQTVNPLLAKEWNYEKNNGLTPMDVMSNSHNKVWWVCRKNKEHEWQAVVGSRNQGRGCPYCTSQKVLKGDNDLQTVNPILASEWNYEKNIGLTPADVAPNSNKKVWWKCSKNPKHEWQISVNTRNRGNGCPFCAGQKILKGENDLQTVNPTLAEEWYYEKNEGVTPSDVMPNTNKKVWWKCLKNPEHEWQAMINSRNRGHGCPQCAIERRKDRK